jgi:hypothetical protein
MALLLVGPRPRRPRPERWRVPWRTGSRVGLAAGLLVVAATTDGLPGAVAAIGALYSGAWAGASAVDNSRGLKDHQQ